MFSRPIDVSKHALIYAGAQKNMGPAGVTVVIIREDLLARAKTRAFTLPTMLNYAVHAENDSLYNTPPVFAVYATGPGDEMAARAGRAAGDRGEQRTQGREAVCGNRSHRLLSRHRAKDSRSLMNVTFRLPSEELETMFVRESAAAGLDGLKGHRAVGGMRASIYNAFPEVGVDALLEFMRDFERRRG